jgi:hypothetical protein
MNPGLQVISGRNGFGKSLAATAIPWCLGLEPMFGVLDNDPSRFPLAVRETIELGGKLSEVLSSKATVSLIRSDGAGLRLERAIKGDCTRVQVTELDAKGEATGSSTLMARRNTMKDPVGGLQHFIYGWLGLPHIQCMTRDGTEAEIYLENIAPLFYIDQNEGWTQLQALQVHRYGLVDVEAAAVEYLLGALEALSARLERQRRILRADQEKQRAELLSQDVERIAHSNGWALDWSSHGKPEEISKRWAQQTLSDALRNDLGVDLDVALRRLRERGEQLRAFLGSGSIDRFDTTASSAASQQVLDLKDHRHAQREEIRDLRLQKADAEELLSSLSHQGQSAADVLRLKTEGVGRLLGVECPTCHRSVDPASFQLTSHSAKDIAAHIGALARDRALVQSNLRSIDDRLVSCQAELRTTEDKLLSAERTLASVNVAIGSTREQLAKAAGDLGQVEREIDRAISTAKDIALLQERISAWLTTQSPGSAVAEGVTGDRPKTDSFRDEFHALLTALGHNGLLEQPEEPLSFDDNYVPYVGARRLRSLGSASDQSRMIAAYTLALASASEAVAGVHPGTVVLDEPLQQNQDPDHRKLFVNFVLRASKTPMPYQVLIFTSLLAAEIADLAEASHVLTVLPDRHFLNPTGSTQVGVPKP